MKQYFYDVYLCTFDSKIDIGEINRRLSSIENKNCINIQSLKGLSESEVQGIINGCLSMERVRLNSVCINPVYANVFELDNKKHIVVLSVCKNVMTLAEHDSILTSVFGNLQQSSMALRGNKKSNHAESVEYWERIFAKKRLALPRRQMPNPEKYYADELNVSEELSRRILRCVNERKRSLKTILYLAVGALMCKGLEATRIILNDIHEGGQLTNIPIVLDSSQKRYDQYESVKRQLINAEYYDNCSTLEMWDKTAVDPSMTPMISALFMYEGKYNEFLTNMQENTVYIQSAIDAEYMNFCIIPRLTNTGFSISYVYSDAVFEEFSISSFHEKLMEYLEEYLFDGVGEDSLNHDISLDDKLIYKSNLEIKEKSSDETVKAAYGKENAERQNKAKLTCLKSINLFSKCSEDTISKIVVHTKIHSLGMGQNIIKMGEWSDRLFIIVKGGLEGWVKGHDYYEIPVEKHMPGAMVGIESLYNDKFSHITFKSCMADTILLSIPARDIIELAGTNPEIICGIIENVGRILEDAKIKNA